MDFKESQNFKIEPASLKEVRVFAREIFKKSSVFENDTDDLVLALAEAAGCQPVPVRCERWL